MGMVRYDLLQGIDGSVCLDPVLESLWLQDYRHPVMNVLDRITGIRRDNRAGVKRLLCLARRYQAPTFLECILEGWFGVHCLGSGIDHPVADGGVF